MDARIEICVFKYTTANVQGLVTILHVLLYFCLIFLLDKANALSFVELNVCSNSKSSF